MSIFARFARFARLALLFAGRSVRFRSMSDLRFNGGPGSGRIPGFRRSPRHSGSRLGGAFRGAPKRASATAAGAAWVGRAGRFRVPCPEFAVRYYHGGASVPASQLTSNSVDGSRARSPHRSNGVFSQIKADQTKSNLSPASIGDPSSSESIRLDRSNSESDGLTKRRGSISLFSVMNRRILSSAARS